MQVMSLIENDRLQGAENLAPEFGLSMVIEIGESLVLFDMGSSSAFADNADQLELDLSTVDAAVISHQHFDHGGGLRHFLSVNSRAPVYLRKAPLVDRQFSAFKLLKRPIGLDLDVVRDNLDRIEFVDGVREIVPGVSLVTVIPSNHELPRGNRRLFAQETGEMVRDPFDHELLMVVHEGDSMVVFTGCSHNGVLNLLDAAIEVFPGTPVKAVFGGFHLIGLPFYNSMAASRREVETLGRQILERVAGPVFTGHCTGKKGYSVLAGVMGERLREFPTGARAEV